MIELEFHPIFYHFLKATYCKPFEIFRRIIFKMQKNYLAHFLATKRKIIDGPHVVEFDHFDLK